MIKKYEDFIKESHSKTIKLNSEDVSLFTSEPLLQKLVADKKVSLFDDEVKYDESDIQTKEVLDQYLELPGKVEEKVGDFESFNEALAGHMGAVHRLHLTTIPHLNELVLEILHLISFRLLFFPIE